MVVNCWRVFTGRRIMKKLLQYYCNICCYSEFRDADQINAFFMDTCPQCRTGKLEKIGEAIYNGPPDKK